MLFQALHRRLVIVFVDFVPGQVQPHVVAGNRYTAAAKMSVEYPVVRFGVVLQEPFIQFHGFLARVNLFIIA